MPSALQTLKHELLGEVFHLRSPLSFAECLRRLKAISPGIPLIPNFSDEPVGGCAGSMIFLTEPTPRGAVLRARMILSGTHTVIRGRAGANDLLFAVLAFCHVVVIVLIVSDNDHSVGSIIGYLSTLIFVWIQYLARRHSPYGGALIDFLQHRLEAEDVLARKGDPIRHG